MLFLLNDVVLTVAPQALTPPLTAHRFGVLTFDSVRELGQELFSDDPELQHNHPTRAQRLAMLLLSKAVRINAALFVAPHADCPPEQVAVRFAEVDFPLLAALADRQLAGRLTPLFADKQVWRRQAA